MFPAVTLQMTIELRVITSAISEYCPLPLTKRKTVDFFSQQFIDPRSNFGRASPSGLPIGFHNAALLRRFLRSEVETNFASLQPERSEAKGLAQISLK